MNLYFGFLEFSSLYSFSFRSIRYFFYHTPACPSSPVAFLRAERMAAQRSQNAKEFGRNFSGIPKYAIFAEGFQKSFSQIRSPLLVLGIWQGCHNFAQEKARGTSSNAATCK